MAPTLKDGDVVLVNRIIYLFKQPRTNDIVAVKDPRDNKILIKRIKKIEKQRFFIVGDNKQNSTDSREFGMIGRNQIVGKVL